MKDIFRRIWQSIVYLPPSVRKVCYVQFFAWLGWFPFLFYSTTYIVEVILATSDPDHRPSIDDATRYGSFTLLPFVSSLATSPFVVRHIAFRHTDGPNKKFLRGMVRRLLLRCTPRNFWTLGTGLFAFLMLGCTFLVKDVQSATVVVAFIGIPWAITCWVPFALVMEYIRDIEDAYDSQDDASVAATVESATRAETLYESHRKSFRRASSYSEQTVTSPPKKHQPFRADQEGGGRYRSTSNVQQERDRLAEQRGKNYGTVERTDESLERERREERAEGRKQVGGTILGIHNLSIVAPQFLVALIASLIFKLVALSKPQDPSLATFMQPGHELESSETDVVYVLRFGGFMSIFACIFSRWIDRPISEEVHKDFIKDISEGEGYGSLLENENGEEP
ncbi:hypothetical protein BT69DRAFT_490252 [Atractiella rhizophila]|nr:hypothetical protein BT69DRAFT_490252 [Atractiella rhizophila]